MSSLITANKKATFDYVLTTQYEAGIVLQGWEVKSLRAGKVQLRDAYVIIRANETWMINCLITPLITTSLQTKAEPSRIRKLLLHRKEIDKIIGFLQNQGVTCLPVKLFWKNGKVKCDLRIATGKKQHDKRQTIKDREWSRDKHRILKKNLRQ